MNLSPSDLGYLAALLDGEGCLTYSRRPNGSAFPRVSVEIAHEGVLQWVKNTTGLGGAIARRKRPGCKPTFRWTVTTRNAAELLRTVRPLLKIKGSQAGLLLELSALTHNRPGGPKLTPDELWSHNLIVSFVRALNQRGDRSQAA